MNDQKLNRFLSFTLRYRSGRFVSFLDVVSLHRVEVDILRATQAPRKMEVSILDPDVMMDIVKKALFRFLDLWKTRSCKSKKTSYNHIDLKISKEHDGYYSIKLTNCGYLEYEMCDILEILRFVFQNSNVRQLLKKKSLALINFKDKEFEVTYDLYYPPRKGLSLKKVSCEDEESIDFPFYRKYFSIKPMYRLMAGDVKKFKVTVLEEISRLCEENTNVKFTYRCDGKMLHNNHVPLDEEYKLCQVLSTTLTDIVRQSPNIKFREKCLAVSKTENFEQLRESLMTQLLPIINENYIFTKNNQE